MLPEVLLQKWWSRHVILSKEWGGEVISIDCRRSEGRKGGEEGWGGRVGRKGGGGRKGGRKKGNIDTIIIIVVSL